jgi:hypothetical protein
MVELLTPAIFATSEILKVFVGVVLLKGPRSFGSRGLFISECLRAQM